ncbi:MAG: amidohydrolase family protein [Bacteroidota bacterium]
MPYQLIDTHLQVWNLDKHQYAWMQGDTSILNQTYEMTEVAQTAHLSGVTGAILVQAANTSAETLFLLNQARRRSGFIRGVVGWTDLTDPEKTGLFLETAREEHPLLKGFRHLIHFEPDTNWLLQPTVIESLKLVAEHGYSFDVPAALPIHLDCVKELGQKVPKLRMVIDHLANPVYFGQGVELWEELMELVAENPNVYAKISGLGNGVGTSLWTHYDIHDLLLRTLNVFGAERTFCGSDWPTCLLTGAYDYTWQQYLTSLEALLDKDEENLVFFQNATNFYKL